MASGGHITIIVIINWLHTAGSISIRLFDECSFLYETNISKSSPGQQQGRAAHGGITLRASIMQGTDARQRYRAAVIEHFGQRSVALNNRIGIGRVFTFVHISVVQFG